MKTACALLVFLSLGCDRRAQGDSHEPATDASPPVPGRDAGVGPDAAVGGDAGRSCDAGAGDAWSLETIAWDDLEVGLAAFAVDADGAPHFASNGRGDPDLAEVWHLTVQGGAWVHEPVDGSSLPVAPRPIRIVAGEAEHVVFTGKDGNVWKLRYATNLSGAWAVEAPEGDQPGHSGADPAIAIDAAGAVHLAYVYSGPSADDFQLRVATNAGGAWLVTTIDGEGEPEGVAMALDGDGAAHVAYRDDSSGSLRHATNATGPWVVETLPARGWSPSIAVEQSGSIHVVSGDGALHHTSFDGAAWAGETVAAAGSVWGASIALGADGSVHVAFGDSNEDEVRYATDASGDWTIETVDAARAALPEIAIAGGTIHVAYTLSDGRIRLARRALQGGVDCSAGD